MTTLAAIAEAAADFNTCRVGTNPTSCAADQTATMLAAHARIGAAREACNACAYTSISSASRPEPPKFRFEAAAETAHTNAVVVFVAQTFMRCNTASLISVKSASADTSGDLLAAYAGVSAVRVACIAAGNPPAPALPSVHPGASPHDTQLYILLQLCVFVSHSMLFSAVNNSSVFSVELQLCFFSFELRCVRQRIPATDLLIILI